MEFNFEEFIAYFFISVLLFVFGFAFETGKYAAKKYFEFENFLKECKEEQE